MSSPTHSDVSKCNHISASGTTNVVPVSTGGLGDEADITDQGVLRHRAIKERESSTDYKRWRPRLPNRCAFCENIVDEWVAFDDGYREGDPWRIAMCDYHYDWWNSLRTDAKQGAP